MSPNSGNGHGKTPPIKKLIEPPKGVNKPPADVESEYRVERARFTPDQLLRLHENAKRAGVEPWELIWKACNQAGII
jgi:hypothetical protein